MEKRVSSHNSVQNLKARKLPEDMLLTSGALYLYTLIFSVFGAIFVIDKIPSVIKIIVGVVFSLPVFLVAFARGKSAGESEYKLKNKSVLADIHTHRVVKVNKAKPFLLAAPFFLSAVLLIVLAECARVKAIQGIMLIVFIPCTLVFMGSGAIDIAAEGVTWIAAAPVTIMAALVSAAYIAGYIVGAVLLENRAGDLINEMRSVG